MKKTDSMSVLDQLKRRRTWNSLAHMLNTAKEVEQWSPHGHKEAPQNGWKRKKCGQVGFTWARD